MCGHACMCRFCSFSCLLSGLGFFLLGGVGWGMLGRGKGGGGGDWNGRVTKLCLGNKNFAKLRRETEICHFMS